ncbi:hypothetical protein [Bacillus vallismortis]|uniref:hypothetical protein n=1 Tax=Bacillus vallismortis TaxID=72361 RepID=UPI002090264B|nr:hypothetical protein [Bacillus vallismortis]MCO4850691.1 hypothetical protein [Bacillus vallismortis]
MYSSSNIDLKLKQSFQSLFPEYASKLEKAASQDDLKKLHNDFVKEQKQELAKALGKDVSALKEVQYNGDIALTNEQYLALINAKDEKIKALLQTMMDQLKRIKELEHGEKGVIVAQMVLAGVIGIGPESIEGAMNYLKSLSVHKDLNSIVTDPAILAKELEVDQSMIVGFTPAEIIAGYAALAALGSSAIIAYVVCIVSIVIISILLGLIVYLAEKQAAAIVLLINETDKRLKFQSDYNVHGKPSIQTLEIRNGIYVPNFGLYPVAGFFATQKKDGALYGTQYGFTMQYGDTDTTFSFGMDCPLTSLYSDNNCYCTINEDAKTAAERTSNHNQQYWESEMNGLKINIRCNSGSGSVAYYIARAFHI